VDNGLNPPAVTIKNKAAYKMPDKNVTLYAVWKPNDVTLIYHTKASKTAKHKKYSVVTLKGGKKFQPIAHPKTTLDFFSWNTSKTGAGTVYERGKNYRVFKGVKLYAQYKNIIDPNGWGVFSLGIEAGAGIGVGAYVGVGANYDGKYLSVTASGGGLIITNIAAYAAGYVAYYPTKKSVDEVNGFGVSVGAAFSVGLHISLNGGFEAQEDNKHGFSVSGGIGVSFPVPYTQVKAGMTKTLVKWELSKVKDGTSQTKSFLGTKIKVTKQSSYTDVYVPNLKKTIRVQTGSKNGGKVF